MKRLLLLLVTLLFPGQATIIYDVYNELWITTASTYSSLITTQPALPTHP